MKNHKETKTLIEEELMKDNLTSAYKKVANSIQDGINKKAQSLTQQLNISDRVEIPPTKQAYITLKDHKPEFPNNLKCRLINPAKSNIGKKKLYTWY